MPKIHANGVNLYYELHGQGQPLLLIAGLGYASFMWFRQVPALSQHFQVIVFDNRGVGRSDKPDVPYSIAMLADDAAGLLTGLNISQAHVFGISMGGYVAQELAIRHPAMVNRLALGCTYFVGAPERIQMPQETLNILLNRAGGEEDIIRRGVEVALAPGFPEREPTLVEQIVRGRIEQAPPPHGYLRQLMAGASFDAEDRVSQITAPTLVLAGEEDRVVPVARARELAARIPHARLALFPGAGHLFFIENPIEVNRALVEFFGR